MSEATPHQPAPMPDDFWGQIDHQLSRIADPANAVDSFDKVRAVLTDPAYTAVLAYTTMYGAEPAHLPSTDTRHDPNACLFAGSGGDASLMAALLMAGWCISRARAHYFYVIKHRHTGETLTYIEGDVVRGDVMGRCEQ